MSRKVRKDFDLTKGYSVDVVGCCHSEKKQVQQAFFDGGILWEAHGENYVFLEAAQYSNVTLGGQVTSYCMYGSNVEGCNVSAEEFLDLVYESEKGHKHAELMTLYAEDAKTTTKPWEYWEFKNTNGIWTSLTTNPLWDTDTEYRRKPKTHIVHGVEVPDLRIEPKKGDKFYVVDLTQPEFTDIYQQQSIDTTWADRGLCYEPTDEGRRAAILHAKAMLGIDSIE